MSLVKNS